MPNSLEALLQERVQDKGIQLGLDRIQRVLDSLGNPEQQLPKIVHIAGTNGKGSTTHYLAQALISLGFQVGSFTSPHILDYCERICVNAKSISQDQFRRLYTQVQQHPLQSTLTEFELLTVMGILFFSSSQLDYVIFETGLGGRLDATNILPSQLSIITKIGYDHQAILGETLPEIAKEKAGIIKPHTPVVVMEQTNAVLTCFRDKASAVRSPLHLAAALSTAAGTLPDFQLANLGVVQKALHCLGHPLCDAALTALPAPAFRYEKRQLGASLCILDSGHNPDGISALIKALKQDYPKQKPTWLLGILKRKRLDDIMPLIVDHAQAIYVMDFSPGDSYSLDDFIGAIAYHKGCPIYPYQMGDPRPDGCPLVVTGSMHFLGVINDKL